MGNDTALLIIDMQAGFFQASEPVYNGPEVLAVVKGLIAQARASGVPVVYVQHNTGGELDGTSAGEIYAEIAPTADDVVVQKHTPDAFQATSLEQELQARGMQHLVVVGFATEYCIDTTCRRAASLGYQVTLVRDGHSTLPTSPVLTPEQIVAHHTHVLQQFATVRSASEIAFAPPPAPPKPQQPAVVQTSLFDLA